MDGDRSGAGRPLRSQTADDVLLAVHRRLRRQHVAAAARSAAWLTVVVATIAVLLHVFVRPIDAVAAAAAVVLTWSIALTQAFFHPLREADCATWADRHLGAESAYETYLEHRDAGGQTPAVQRLLAWIDSSARRSVERLASMPDELRLAKPFGVAAVALLLMAALLQVPTQTPASMARGSSAAAATAGASVERERRDSRTDSNVDPAVGSDIPNSLSTRRNDTTSGDASRAPAAAGAPAEDAPTREARGDAGNAPAGEHAAAGGQDAGQTADTLADTGLSEAWQGEMATKLRELANTDQQPSEADPMLAADYQPAATPQQAAASAPAFAPAAAVAPEAHSRVRLGPAEQAYVRSYFADSGATP